MSVYVIAEIGANHDGEYRKMLRAFDAAQMAGANAAKLQWVSDPEKMAARRGKASEDGYADVYRKYLAWDPAWHEDLANECYVRGLDYMCTAYLPEDVAVVAPYVRHAKIASFEAEDEQISKAWVKASASWNNTRHIIVSLGMGAAWGPNPVLAKVNGLPYGRVKRLHCISSYPAPHDELNLSRLWSTWDSDGCEEDPLDGFSDHSSPRLTCTGALAVAAGAHIIEAHLRLPDTDSANPDFRHAMTVKQFSSYIVQIRFAERCLGTGDKGLQPSEREMAQYRVGKRNAKRRQAKAAG